MEMRKDTSEEMIIQSSFGRLRSCYPRGWSAAKPESIHNQETMRQWETKQIDAFRDRITKWIKTSVVPSVKEAIRQRVLFVGKAWTPPAFTVHLRTLQQGRVDGSNIDPTTGLSHDKTNDVVVGVEPDLHQLFSADLVSFWRHCRANPMEQLTASYHGTKSFATSCAIQREGYNFFISGKVSTNMIVYTDPRTYVLTMDDHSTMAPHNRQPGYTHMMA